MAQIISNGFLDFRGFNLFGLTSEFDHFGFWDDANRSIDNTEIPGFVGTYTAQDFGAFWSGAPDLENATSRFLVGGENLVIDANNNAVSGMVTGMLYTGSEAGSDFHFAIAGFNVGAVAFQAVATSQSSADDIALLKDALSGNDRITGSAFGDFAYGWTGNDKLFGNDGNDTLIGDTGKDQIRGGKGNDRLTGGTGNDSLFGDAGKDRIEDGTGTDRLTGGTGADKFVFAMGRIDNDLVTDFEDGIDTLILDLDVPVLTPDDFPGIASDIAGGVRIDFDNGEVLTILGVTKAELEDQVQII